jgi:hypothetical protein
MTGVPRETASPPYSMTIGDRERRKCLLRGAAAHLFSCQLAGPRPRATRRAPTSSSVSTGAAGPPGAKKTGPNGPVAER